MSYRGGRRNNFRNKDSQGSRNSNQEQKSVTNPRILQEFQQYASELDEKHDRHERLVKGSRDITIESKRIIFLLHNIDPRKNNKESIIEEAKSRIEKLCDFNFAIIAKELHNLDIYQHLRAVSAGIQEFIEAYSFLEYMQGEELSDWESIEKRFQYKSEEDGGEDFSFKLVPSEFVLGLADLTGEVMRTCINSLGSGDADNCFKTCNFLQKMYSNFLTVNSVANRRDFNQKMNTMRASTIKCEQVAYNLKVRGSEGSKLISFDAVEDVDEGFY